MSFVFLSFSLEYYGLISFISAWSTANKNYKCFSSFYLEYGMQRCVALSFVSFFFFSCLSDLASCAHSEFHSRIQSRRIEQTNKPATQKKETANGRISRRSNKNKITKNRITSAAAAAAATTTITEKKCHSA